MEKLKWIFVIVFCVSLICAAGLDLDYTSVGYGWLFTAIVSGICTIISFKFLENEIKDGDND